MNAPTDKDKNLLRQALGQFATETMPAPGWEQRVLPRRRPRRLVWLIPAAAAAIAAIITVGTYYGASTPATTHAPTPAVIAVVNQEPELPPLAEVAEAAEAAEADAPGRVPTDEITVLLPEPEPTEAADYPDIPIGDYIDIMIEEQLLANAEIISTIL